MQRVLGPHQQGRRRAPPGALQGGQHLDDLGAARIERSADLLLAGIERAQPRLGIADPGLDAAHLGCDVDQLLIELAAVLTDRGDLGLQFGLRFRGALLLRAGGFEFLLALLDGVGRSGGGRLGCGAVPATWAETGSGPMPAKPADNNAMESGRRRERGPAAASGVRVRTNVARWLHRSDSVAFSGLCAGAAYAR